MTDGFQVGVGERGLHPRKAVRTRSGSNPDRSIEVYLDPRVVAPIRKKPFNNEPGEFDAFCLTLVTSDLSAGNRGPL